MLIIKILKNRLNYSNNNSLDNIAHIHYKLISFK